MIGGMFDFMHRHDAAENLKRGDLRDMQFAHCHECRHEWWAPVIGKCPRCRSGEVRVTKKVMISAPRV